VVAELAVYKEMVQKIDSTAEAVGYLQRHGVIDLLDNTDRPNRATLVKILAEEDGMRVYDDVLPEDIKKAVQERLAKDEENLFILRSITPTEVVDDD
jgi:Mg/Co/Ni transporter MgtE